MLLDDTTTRASQPLESSLVEDSFVNEQSEEFQPNPEITSADEQIYADQNFQYIPQSQRVTPRSSSAKPSVNRAEAIDKAKRAAQKNIPKSAAKKPASKSAGSSESKYQQALHKAQQVGQKAKDLKNKHATNKDQEQAGGKSEQGLAEKLKPDYKKLAHDATHGDPRKVVGDLADQYLHAGKVIGTGLWGIWGASAVISLIPFVITAIPGAIMFNLLLVSPKLVYTFTKWILDLIGIGEALTVAGQFGLNKVDIRLSVWQKATIIAYDFVFFILIIAFFTLILSIGKYLCDQIGGNVVTGAAIGVAGKVVGWWGSGNYVSVAAQMCTSLNSIGK